MQSGYSQTPSLKEINFFAVRGEEHALVLLDKLKPSINFDYANDTAFEYLLNKYTYYKEKFDKRSSRKILKECENYYNNSTNERLKIWYRINLVKINEIELFLNEDEIRKNRNKAIEDEIRKNRNKTIKLNLPKLTIQCNRLLFKIFRRQLLKDSMNYYLDDAMRIAKENNLKVEVALVKRIRAVRARQSSNFDQSLKLFDEAIEIYREEGFQISMARVMLLQGLIYQDRRQYRKANSLYEKASVICQEKQILSLLSEIHQLIGRIHQDLDNHQEALNEFQQSKDLLQEDLFPFRWFRLKTYFAVSYLALGNIEEAKIQLEKSITQKIKFDDNFTLGKSYNVYGKLFLKEGKFKQAKTQFNQVISLSNKLKFKKSLENTYMGLAQVALAENDIESSEKYAKKSLKYAIMNEKIKTKYSALAMLADLATRNGNYRKATQYHQASLSLRDSIINFSEVLKTTNLLINYENQKKEIEILKLEIENQEKAAVIQKNKHQLRFYLISFFAGLGLLFLIILFFIQNKQASRKQEKLNQSLNESNRKLSESNHQLEQFAQMASHDLKSPLTTIIAYSSLLGKTAMNKFSGAEKSYFDVIVRNGGSLVDMIDDILAYSKVDAQNITREEMCMNLLIEDVFSSLAGQAQKNDVILINKMTPIKCMIDHVKLKRVFQNIISNAIKFSDSSKNEKHVFIDYEKSDDFFTFSIKDNGIGIGQTDKDIFKPFTHLNSKKDYSGTGMGLTMSKKIIQKHGGEIWYESEPEKGTTFFFTVKKG